MASILDKVDVHDAGDKIILSSGDEATLRYVVQEMRKEGAQDIQAPVKVGGKWIASFEHPSLSQCTVEKIGFQIIIEGPPRPASSPDPENSGSGERWSRAGPSGKTVPGSSTSTTSARGPATASRASG